MKPVLMAGYASTLAVVLFAVVLLLGAGATASQGRLRVPRYCIDPSVLALFQGRLASCGIVNPLDAIAELHRTDAVEYQRGSHELHAYQWFSQPYNPHRAASCLEAEFEYIPLLPLHWKVQQQAGRGGGGGECTYQALIDSITALVKLRPAKSPTSSVASPQPFAVASTFNMRTEMGTGMRTQVRRGEQYDQVTSFVTSTFLGHYERWPQCPDLLRKGWLGIVELPYVALGEAPGHHAGSRDAHELGDAGRLSESEDGNPAFAAFVVGKERRPEVLFMGRLNQLYGPELVCSVRWSIFDLAKKQRTSASSLAVATAAAPAPPPLKLRLVNITASETSQGVQPLLVAEFRSASFCLVAKGDSYSSASLYSAIEAGCVPVVVSDWFVFAFPWAVPYERFVVRFSESSWLADPEECLRALRDMPPAELRRRRAAMFRYRALLSWHALPAQSGAAQAIKAMWTREQRLLLTSTSPAAAPLPEQPTDWKYNTVLPLELMLVELGALVRNLRLEQQSAAATAAASASAGGLTKQKQFGLVITHDQHKIFSCETPFHCTSNATDFSGTVAPPMALPSLQNRRSHLCTHTHRLIGMYKMVYWQKCVRILWPLQPGKLKPADTKLLSSRDRDFVEHFHNVSHNPRPPGWQLFPYPPL